MNSPLRIQILVVALCFTTTSQAQSSWVQNPGNGHWYTTTAVGDWHTAEAEARALGGHLATVRNPAENDWLFQTFAQTDNIWIGFSDELVEGSWEWVNGETTAGTKWAMNQPDNDWIGQHWAYIIRGSSTDPVLPPSYWDDAYFYTTMIGVVEVPRDPSGPHLSSSSPVAGQMLTLTVNQVSPGSLVHFAWSSSGGGPISNQYGFMELSPPIHLLNPQVADLQGVVVKTGYLPSFLQGFSLWIQAWSTSDMVLSNGIQLDIQ